MVDAPQILPGFAGVGDQETPKAAGKRQRAALSYICK